MLTGVFSPSGARSAGQEAIAEASEAQEARIARFSASVRDGCDHHVLGVLEDGAGVKERLKVENVVVGGGRRPHGFLRSKTSRAAARSPGRRDSAFAQAALDSIWCTLACAAPLMAIRRGFMASGISRTSSIFSRPLSKDASLTWT